MRLVFAGTPEFAAVSLRRLLAQGHEIVLVLTQPDRPSGRGLQSRSSSVKALATRYGLPLMQPPTLKDAALQQELLAYAADAWVVAAYGLILPATLVYGPTFGCVNVHASLLPRWRGAAPIQRAIMAGDRETGVSIMQMDAGLDTGPVYLREALPIAPADTAGTLHNRLAALGADMVVDVLERVAAGTIATRPQPATGITYAGKIDRAESRIDWTWSAERVERQLRALDPVPGAATALGEVTFKVWQGVLGRADVSEPPGSVLEVGQAGIEVACGQGTLVLRELQRAGGRRLCVTEFLRGFPIRAGARFVT